MIIAFNCSQQTKAMLDSVLSSGGYKDYGELIEVAVGNLAALQLEMGDQASLVLDGGSVAPARARRPRAIQRTLAEDERPRVPQLFRQQGLDARPATFAEPPKDDYRRGEVVPIDRWLFGQYNRLLPGKASCRALAHLILHDVDGPLLEKAAAQIAEDASVLGDLLSRHDSDHKLVRDDKLSTAFPTNTSDLEKAKVRFASQFVGYADKQGRLFGLLVGLKLINWAKSGSPRILLTEAGWEFARMPNPILDATGAHPREKLSQDEKRFLLAHIARSVAVEDFAYRAILRAVSGGADTPDKLDKALHQYAPADRDIRDSYVSTQRSGALSRMVDLDLLARARHGTKVSYEVEDAGPKYMGN